jgi:two-component system nitrate/nitrite response regulator NarL
MARGVLIVDDSAGFRAQARGLLVAAGFEVLGEAGDGLTGVRAVRELTPEVVLLDVQLPDVSGFDVARMLREEPNRPAVILISTREASDYGRGIDRSGADGFIWKAELSARALEAVLEGIAR